MRKKEKKSHRRKDRDEYRRKKTEGKIDREIKKQR
jgi:hypothetical protein